MIKFTVANIFSLGNAFCGVLSLMKSSENNLYFASLFIFIGAIFDLIDGPIARLTKTTSEDGKLIDSFADFVTFGVAPTMILYKLPANYSIFWLKYLLGIFALMALIRLVKFSNEKKKIHGFIGVPSPISGVFIASIPLVYEENISSLNPLIENGLVLLLITLISSLLMVSPLKTFSLKPTELNWNKSKLEFGFIIICIGLFGLFQLASFPIIYVLYVFISLLKQYFLKKASIFVK